MNSEKFLMAFVSVQIAIDVFLAVILFSYGTNFVQISEFGKDVGEMSLEFTKTSRMMNKMMPLLTDSYNNMVEGTFTDNPKIVHAVIEFRKTMSELVNSTKLNDFFNCSEPFNSYIINSPLFENRFSGSREMIGFEMAFFDINNEFEHKESIYVTEDLVVYEKFGCARITYNVSKDEYDVDYFKSLEGDKQ